MKILIATMSMGIGGAETHILELCRELCRRGHEITVVSSGGELVSELTSCKAKHITLPLDKKDIFSVLKSRRALSRLIKSGGFDIVHAHARIPAFICSGICKKNDVRFVTTAHGAFSVTALWKKLSRWGEHTFAVSEDIARYLRRNYMIESSNISLIPNGIDRARFKPDAALRDKMRAELGAVGKTVALHISRLDGPAAVCAESFIRAAENSAGDDIVFVCVGGGDRFSALSDIADKINESAGTKKVIMCGAMTDIRPYLCAADIFVGPSRAALEAMSVGLPTIISGSEGHIGTLDENNFKFARDTNLCARNAEIASDDVLFREISAVRDLDISKKAELISLQEKMLEYYSISSMADICEKEYFRLSAIKTKKEPSAVICGYYGYGNAGDRAMLLSLISGIRKINASAPLCVMSSSPKKTSGEFVVSSFYRYDIIAITRALRRSGTLIFGGGNLLQDKTSVRSLMYYLFVIRTAKRVGARVLIYANGLGPLSDKNMPRVMSALNGADRVSIRERDSFELCRKHGINAVLTADPAFSLGTADKCAKRGGYFVIAPKNSADDEFEKIARIATMIKEKHRLTPVFAAMYPKQDGDLCARLANKTGGLMLEDGITDYGIISRFVDGAEFVISSRLHALVCSAAAGCPMIGVGGGKILGLMREMGVSSFASDSFDDVLPLVDKIILSRDEISKTITQNAKKAEEASIKEIEAITFEISK